MAWKVGFKLNPGSTTEGTITAVWDDPPFTYQGQGTIDSDDKFFERADTARDKYFAELNSKADIEAKAMKALQAIADARPAAKIAISPNVKPTPKVFLAQPQWANVKKIKGEVDEAQANI
jgi:hypothetical protein